MDEKKIIQAIENSVLKEIGTGGLFKFPYESKIDLGAELKTAYRQINYEKVMAQVTNLLEEEIARKLVNKIITEMGNDIKKLMSSNETREDLKYFMRKGVEEVLKKVRE